jgi:pilus assembly protein CpaE
MTDKISVLIVDDILETRESVRKLLQFETDLSVVGQAGSGVEAIELARQHRPNVVLMDINMPDDDGISASHTLTKAVPESQVIIMSVQNEADYVRRAMLAGARDFLMKPFSGDELVEAVRRVHENRPIIAAPVVQQQANAAAAAAAPVRHGKITAVYSPKGGAGCTTVAVNLAVSIAEKGFETLLIDGSLQFGDVGIMLNLKPVTSVVDLVERISELDHDLISSVVLNHQRSGLNVLLSPPRPEMAELVQEKQLRSLMRTLRLHYDYIIVDTSTALNDVNLAMLDTADRIILLTRQSLPSLKNVSRFFDLTNDLEYEDDKVMLVVNHGSKKLNISVTDIADTLKWPVIAVVPEDELADSAANRGIPLVSDEWRRRPASRAIIQLSSKIVAELEHTEEEAPPEQSNGSSPLSRLFGR